MHSDARTLPNGSELEGDLCIVGAGAAGISMAREFADSKHDVILLEAGGFEHDSDMQALYEGENTGLPYYPLSRTRLRYFGGTTGHWAGWCSRLDPIDFERRDWVPMSGWPLSLKDLKPYYRKAHPLLDLGYYNYEMDYWKKRPDGFTPLFDSSNVQMKVFKRSTPTRFGDKYRTEITQANNLTLWTHANVTEIETPRNGSEVTGLRVQCLNGKEHHVSARNYVLACGGLENPRLLLNSNRENSDGIGNKNGHVGRYFMDHPHMRSARLILTEWPESPNFRFPDDPGGVHGLVSLGSSTQRSEKILNYTAFLYHDMSSLHYENPRARLLEKGIKYYLNFGNPEFELSTRIEQRPNPNSRVSLSKKRDALGQLRIELNWELTEDERRTVRIANEAIAEECGRLGIGRLQQMDWVTGKGKIWPDSLHGGHHHMGTTRMSESPKRGVVDANSKVHGVSNLYIAGSSIFPTSGTANPTLTIVAMALRLADHLEEELQT